jgi:hypothetical protein
VVAQSFRLTCHPATSCDTVISIDVQALRRQDAALEIRYTVRGDLEHVVIPAECSPLRADKLWQHTCFEAFVADSRGRGYTEFNFSPSTEWAIYRFSAYRQGMTVFETAQAPAISVRRDTTHLTLEAVVDLNAAPVLRDGPALRLALSAVIEDAEHRLSYWALAHPLDKPDFHHADGFALLLPNGEGRESPTLSLARARGSVGAGEGRGGGRKPK